MADDNIPRSILSAGTVLYPLLKSAAEVPVFAVYRKDLRLPYIFYSRTGYEASTVKTAGGLNSVGEVTVEVNVCGSTYDQSLELAEKVNQALDNLLSCTYNGLRVRGCHLSDASEYYADDAFVQTLIYKLKIS